MGSSRCFLAIGIQSYDFRPLPNAKPDAASLATKFKTMGYRTKTSCELEKAEDLRDELHRFGQDMVAKDTEVIVMYVAAHGISSEGKVYILLKSATGDDDLSASVEIDDILNQLLSFNSRDDCFVLLICDCCRSALSEAALQNSEVRRQSRWLHRRHAIMWSTAANKAADDGEPKEGNGPFADSLIYFLDDGIKLDDLRNKVVKEVKKRTKGRQEVRMDVADLSGLEHIFRCEGSAQVDLEAGSTTLASSFLTNSTSLSRMSRQCRRRSSACCRVIGLLVTLLLTGLVGFAIGVGSTIESCKLGHWQNGPCDTSCGGGHRQQVRQSGHECPQALRQHENRTDPMLCNVLACPADCCFESTCPFEGDLQCNSTSCEALLNVSLCEYPLELSFDSTVYGRPVRWILRKVRHETMSLVDEETGIGTEIMLNMSAKLPSKQAACECLRDFSIYVLRKSFRSKCIDLRPNHELAMLLVEAWHAPTVSRTPMKAK